MRAEHIFVIWSTIRTRPSRIPIDRFKAVLLMQFLFVCASVVSYVTFVLSLFVPHLSFFLCHGMPGKHST